MSESTSAEKEAPLDEQDRVPCGSCYAPLPKSSSSRCGKCRKRHYCNRECQVEDWKLGRHKTWCGKAGEVGYDFQVVDIAGKGKGVIALRGFAKAERVMYERRILSCRTLSGIRPIAKSFKKLSEAEKNAILDLFPSEADLFKKFSTNSMSCGEEDELGMDSGLFVTMSRLNHSCLSNTNHWYEPYLKSKVLFACRDIAEGEELTIAYSSEPSNKQYLLSHYGFVCTCEACSNPEIAAKVKEIKRLDNEILILGMQMNSDMAIRAGKRLLKLYDELHWPTQSYVRTCYDIFQVAIMKRATLKEGLHYMQLGLAMEQKQYEGLNEPERLGSIAKYASYLKHPESHRNYLIAR
ncbi:hypothetical protein GUITHDRAFT_134519 [Guillardia theta CCMP2712]|uniref:MYND-type domain-containing protein n=1 Tax=Guillardia theta (strain CCMP2712) TaxID=905079 RepID=L1JU62_GUITC|nr:hypothetical protein GUITHDRAFT_134519 [Guillardia theta CCMP2712]EKX51628.1 hypothetical protein GUITHDRAFT_134519 [Guillardia theta CCMP2712]|eukprot:XP_005838608.1 hypothetical protein GUITHDRAFT_134519 [Guillardia theta CCMP2712]